MYPCGICERTFTSARGRDNHLYRSNLHAEDIKRNPNYKPPKSILVEGG